jgi:hypothetical protein
MGFCLSCKSSATLPSSDRLCTVPYVLCTVHSVLYCEVRSWAPLLSWEGGKREDRPVLGPVEELGHIEVLGPIKEWGPIEELGPVEATRRWPLHYSPAPACRLVVYVSFQFFVWPYKYKKFEL